MEGHTEGFAKDRRSRLRSVEGHEQLLISVAQTEADNQAYREASVRTLHQRVWALSGGWSLHPS